MVNVVMYGPIHLITAVHSHWVPAHYTQKSPMWLIYKNPVKNTSAAAKNTSKIKMHLSKCFNLKTLLHARKKAKYQTKNFDDDKLPFVRTYFWLLFHFRNYLNSLNCCSCRFSLLIRRSLPFFLVIPLIFHLPSLLFKQINEFKQSDFWIPLLSLSLSPYLIHID